VKFIARVKCTARAELVAPMKRPVILFSILMNAQCGRILFRTPFGYVSLMNVLDELSFVTTLHGIRCLEPANQSVSQFRRGPPPRESLSTRTLSSPLPSYHNKPPARSGRGTCITVEMGTIRLPRTLASCTHSSRMSRCTAKRPLAAPTRGPTDSESSPVASGCMSACHGLSYSLIT
jgi:hypothetical protein